MYTLILCHVICQQKIVSLLFYLFIYLFWIEKREANLNKEQK